MRLHQYLLYTLVQTQLTNSTAYLQRISHTMYITRPEDKQKIHKDISVKWYKYLGKLIPGCKKNKLEKPM